MLGCALAGDDDFSDDCTVERISSDDGLILVFRHPDGGFRRVRVVGDGRGLVSADGAQEAMVSPAGENRIMVMIGDDRYTLPATIRPGARRNEHDDTQP